MVVVVSLPPRERLQADRMYFVRTDGDNSNNGFGEGPSRAFRDWQHAVDIASQVDFNGFNVTLQASDESERTEFSQNVTVCPLMGGGRLIISGNGPERTRWSSVAGDTWTLSATGSVQVIFQNGYISSAGNGIKINYSSLCNIGDGILFGAIKESAIWIHDNQAICQILNSRGLTIEGVMNSFLFIQYGHCFLEGAEINGINGAQFDHGFITMYPRGTAQVIANRVSGEAKGRRYNLHHLSLLNLGGKAAESQLLGDEHGTTDTTSVVI